MNFTDRKWHAATYHLTSDGIAEVNLRNQGYEVWAPKIRGMKTHSRLGMVEFLVPACPGYILVGVAPDQPWEPILSTRGVSGLLMSGGRPLAASLADLQQFATMFDDDGIFDTVPKPQEPLTIGEEVRVTSGAYAGWVGPVAENPSAALIKILLTIFGRPTITTVRREQIARLKSPEPISVSVR